MNIVGLSSFYHDSAVTIIKEGDIQFAAQEERYTRIKNDDTFPSFALSAGLNECKLKLNQIHAFVFYEKPFLKLERLLETYLNHAPKGFESFRSAFPVWSKEKLFQRQRIIKYLNKIDPNIQDLDKKIFFCEHHISHGASAFYPSPFEEALVLTLDGVGEWATTCVQIGQGSEIQKESEIHFPHSLGLYYSTLTSYLGFKVNSGEYKVMGLAPYGEPIYKNKLLDHLFHLFEDGSFCLEQKYFQYATGLKMYSPHLIELLGIAPRHPDDPLEKVHMDLAASCQAALEEVVLKMIRQLHKKYKLDNLCLAGGVALNCVLNSKIAELNLFKRIWVQPASGDAGGSLGAALYYWHQTLKKPRTLKTKDSMKGTYLGSQFKDEDIKLVLDEKKAVYKILPTQNLIDETAQSLAEGLCVGWFQGAMEFGPRALGNRSILADPRSGQMQKLLNTKIKNRESFRPFAPAVLEEKASQWFTFSESPYMQFTAQIIHDKQIKNTNSDHKGFDRLKELRSPIPAVTHIDYSARLQTVSYEINPLFHKLISRFEDLTDIPVLINTSFNVRGEPIVCSPLDAWNCFMGTDLDILVVGPYFLKKSEQHEQMNKNFKKGFELD